MDWRSEIEGHYNSVWFTTPIVSAFNAGPIHQLPPSFAVLKYPPNESRKMWTYATCCMSQPEDSRPIELHMFSLVESEHITELLFATAHYHRTQAPLDLNHTVNFGRPWLAGARCEYGLISLPYLDGPKLETLDTHPPIQFYWLIPVCKAEVDYKKSNGIEALENAWEEANFDYLDPKRPSVV